MGVGYVAGLQSQPYRSQFLPSSRFHLGDRRARPQPILLLPISVPHNSKQCCTTSLLSYGSNMGQGSPQLEDSWRLDKPRPIHHQRTRISHNYGKCWLPVCIRCAFAMLFRLSPWLIRPPKTDIVAVQRVYYNQIFSFGCACSRTPTFHFDFDDLMQTSGCSSCRHR